MFLDADQGEVDSCRPGLVPFGWGRMLAHARGAVVDVQAGSRARAGFGAHHSPLGAARRGMVMGWEVIDGQRTRVVREDVLLAWWRDTMDSNPVHQLRLRKRLEAAGIA